LLVEKKLVGENGDSALFFLLKIGRCPHFPLGALSAAQVNIIGYYFGSSHSSAQKNEMVSKAMGKD